jgi:hypothetical protein
VVDPFKYSLRLRTGELMNFESAEFAGEFVHLATGINRGLDVRIADIVWCRDRGDD